MKNNEKYANINEIFERIKSILNVGKYKEMLEILDIKRGTFDNWKQRGAIPMSQIIIIADKLGVSKETLMKKDIEVSTIEEPTHTYNKDVNMVTVPYHSEVYASAGGGSDATNMVDTKPIMFSRMFLNSYLGVYDLQGLSMINAAGDSMEPTIRSGAVMFVYPVEHEGFKDGGIYVLMCGDALLVKRVSLDPVTKVYTLISDNGKVSPIEMTIDEGSDCRFVGRVVGNLDRV